MIIYVSGLYSGTNPQPGVGIARSLRQAFPQAKLVGVEYSNRCSGVHWGDFDDIWLQRPWSELNLKRHAEEIERRLDEGGYWISSIDLEILWLAETFPEGHRGLLTPPMEALRRVSKPQISAAEGLPVRIPEYVNTDISDWELHGFCREHNWKVWLKGPYYEAVRTPTWDSLQHWRGVLSKAWATETLYLQAHVTGYEESVMFSAHQGELLDAVHMRKRDLTELGKTWAGDTSPVEPEMLKSLRTVVRELNWSGGGEFEMVRDAEGQRWLLECNPRFPAWVHGSTITGQNLPAVLVEAASGIKARKTVAESEEFTRVVIEIPVRSEFPLSPLPEPFGGAIGHSMKHPSGLIEFAQKLHKSEGQPNGPNGNGHARVITATEEDVPETYIRDLETVDFEGLLTPAPLYFAHTATDIFRRTAEIARSAEVELHPTHAYSIKTNPDERLIRLAKENGMLAEAISTLEAKKAVKAGFRTNEVILNGPAKWWRREELPDGEYHAVFCDSVEELEQVVRDVESGALRTRTLGVRLRTPNIVSRFGIPIDSPELFAVLINAVKKIPRSVRFGIHFHMASSNVGVRQWRHLFKAMLRWCGAVEALSNRMVETLDIGGGWFPGDMHRNDGHEYREIVRSISEHMTSVSELVCEPGKALAQSSMALAMRILEIRRYVTGSCEVVMDGSIAELPMYAFQPHRILSRDAASGDWRPLQRGDSLLLGRLCMEHDIVASNVAVPDDAKAGDVLVFCDAGAYDRSMSYVFGCG
jgi:diaminopimelate decarboxylase